LLLLFSLVPYEAIANQVTLTWTNATENTDGTPIEATGPTALKETVIQWSACDASTPSVQPPAEEVIVPPTATEVVIATGSGYFCFQGKHVNEAGEVSDWSNVAQKEVFSTPLPPGDLVTQGEIVYSVSKLNDGFLLLAVGKVPLGTACIKTQSVNGKYVVPTSEVQWDTANRAPVVVADCGN
jgi:hypothetical protein